jgi:multiple sugar transport system substrate-binding protein
MRLINPAIGWRAVATAALVALVAPLTACGSESDPAQEGKPQAVTLRFAWWGNADRAALTETAVEAFEKKYPHITVETSFAEFNAYFQKLATEVSGGAGPDVLQMDFRYLREYAERNQLAKLNTRGVTVNTKEISPSLLTSGKVKDALYAVPAGQNTQVFSYDAAEWSKHGAAPTENWTWDDLKAATQKVSDGSGGAIRGATDFGGIEDWFEVWLRQKGELLYTDEGKLGYTAKEVAEWWTFTEDLRKSGAVTPADVTSKADGSTANDPVAKKIASSGFGYDSGMTPKTWEIMGRELTLVNFPSSDPKNLGQYAKPSMQFAVSAKSAHPKEAAKLIDFLVNDPEAANILGMSRGLPPNGKNLATVGATLTGPPVAAYKYEEKVGPRLKNAPPPPPKGSGAVKQAFQRVYEEVIFGRKTPEAAAETFMSEAKTALEG